MSVNIVVRLRTFFFICLIILGLPSEFMAQGRIFARFEPNKGKINGTAEIYDPVSQVFTLVPGPMFAAREGHTETRLLNGKVLITGGMSDTEYFKTAEIYEPSTKTFAETTKVDQTTKLTVESTMNSTRTGHTATLLNNGMVLIVGGYDGSYLSTAELFSPTTGVFTSLTNSLTEARAYHTATLQPDGQVVIIGGYNGSYLKTIEVFDPSTHKFTEISATTNDTRAHHAATLMSTGEILITGGYNGDYLDSAVIYTPSSESSRTLAKTLTSVRSDHAACALQDGKVLIAGGTNASPLATAEIFDPATSAFTATASPMTTARDNPTMTVLSSGKVLVAGGAGTSPTATADIYDPSSGKFSANPNSMAFARQNHTATLLSNGTILLAGGQNGNLLQFDINTDTTDDIAPNIVFTSDSTTGFVSFARSGAVAAFSTATGALLKTISTGGKPSAITPLPDGHTLAVLAALDNRVFLIDTKSMQLVSTLSFSGAQFGFGSIVAVSHGGTLGFISSTGTGEVIKFSLPDGKELGRLTGLQAPAQITLTLDDATLMVVDTNTAQLVFVDVSTMKQKYTLSATDTDSAAVFGISNNPVLSADGTVGVIASHGLNSDSQYTMFYFQVSTGKVLATKGMSNVPGYTALTPDGQHFVILTQNSLFNIPLVDPNMSVEISTQGEALGSSNVVFSADSKYAYYPSATSDYFLQQDLNTVAVVGQLNVGDDPNVRVDETASVAVTPDGKTFAALNFVTNNIALIVPETVLNSTKYDFENGVFTSLSLVNVSARPANLTITAMSDFGSALSDSTDVNFVNPVILTLPANAQISTPIEQLFNFTGQQSGWLKIESDQPGVVGYTTIGRFGGSVPNTFIEKCNGVPLFSARMFDFIIPEVSRATGISTEFDFVNRNANTATYDTSRIMSNGVVEQKTTDTSISGSNRNSRTFATDFTQAQFGFLLVAGGENSTDGTLSSAEYFSSDAQTFTGTTSDMIQALKSQMSLMLSDGTVLLVGGMDGSNVIQNEAQIYDPSAVTFSATAGAMNIARYRGTATLLQDGRVLVAGGQTPTSTTDTAELYDPASGTFTLLAGRMTSPRSDQTATLLQNGKVLLVGGSNGSTILSTAELFDPRTGTFTAAGPMATSRAFHTAALLANGQVLIAGGYNGGYLNSGEIYDPSTGSSTPLLTNMAHARAYHTSTVLDDGRVLIVGGADATGVLDTSELFDPSITRFVPSYAVLSVARKSHAAALLKNDNVVILGGSDGTNSLDSAEIYDPLTDNFSTSSNKMTKARNNFTAAYISEVDEAYLRIQSVPGLTFSEFYGGADSMGALNGIDMSKYGGVTKLFSPQFATVPGFQTILNIINGNAQSGTVTIVLHNADGSQITAPASFTLSSGAQLKNDLVAIFSNDPRVQGMVGWVEIDSTVDQVVGTVSFTDSDNVFLTSFELQGIPLADSVYPLASQNNTYMTGIALLNPDSSAANVRLELWAPDGTLSRVSTINLPGGTRTAQYLDQFFQNLGSVMVSNVRIHSDTPIFGFALLSDFDVHFLLAIPPIPFPPVK